MEGVWTHLVKRNALAFATPLPAIDLERVEAWIEDVAERHASNPLKWCPETSWSAVPAVAEAFRRQAISGVSVGDLTRATAAVAAGIESVTVQLPPVVARQPARFADLCRSASMTTVCDHYAQAERVAEACRAAGTSADILLRIDVGRQRLGVRPGPDLSDLARGVGSLRGVRLAGLWVGDAATTAEVGALDMAALSHLLRRCRTSLARARQEAARISVPRFGVEPEVGATEVRDPIPSEERGGTAIVAGVIGRPTRDQAVVDAGRRVLGDTASVISNPGEAEVAFVGKNFSVLSLDLDRQDLAIGDLVMLRPSQPIDPWSGQEVLVYGQGRWRVERFF